MSDGAILKKVYDMGEDRFLCPIEIKDDTTYSALIDGDGNRYGTFLFRESGGPGNGFKNGYARLFHYNEVEEKEEWVIIDRKGDIKFIQNGLNYLYLQGGHIVYARNEGYFSLKTGEKIMCEGCNGASFDTDEYLFILNEYNVDFEMGVHKINKFTLEVEVTPKKK